MVDSVLHFSQIDGDKMELKGQGRGRCPLLVLTIKELVRCVFGCVCLYLDVEIKIHVTYSGGAFKIEMVEILMTEHPIKLRGFDKKAPIF